MKETTPEVYRRDAALWLDLLGSPIVWLIQFQANYTLVPWACAHHVRWIIPTVAVVSLLLIAAVALSSWRRLHGSLPRTGDESLGDVVGRARFMVKLGLCLDALFFLVIIAQTLAVLFIHPCAE